MPDRRRNPNGRLVRLQHLVRDIRDLAFTHRPRPHKSFDWHDDTNAQIHETHDPPRLLVHLIDNTAQPHAHPDHDATRSTVRVTAPPMTLKS